MGRKALVLLFISLLLIYVGIASGANIKTQFPNASKQATTKMYPLLMGYENIAQANYHPQPPGFIAASPGDTVGWTQYDYQSNGSTGNRIAVDGQGSIQVDWMNGIVYPSARAIFYNFRNSGGWEWPGGYDPGPPERFYGGIESSHARGAGYCQISLTTDDRAVLAYHRAPTGAESTFVAIDAFEGLGSFSYYRPQIWFSTAHCIWPYVTVDRNNRIHLTATEAKADMSAGDQLIGYTRSTNGGSSWSSPAIVDTNSALSTIIISSPVSDKVAIIYTNPIATANSIQNDLYYVQSTDGLTWDFANGKINVTNYLTDADSFWAYADCDGVYDYNDNLHLIWNAIWIDSIVGTQFWYEVNMPLMHWSSATGTINMITRYDSTWVETGCETGGWNLQIAKMSIGVDPTNNGAMFATYTSWYPYDCSLGGFANGEIFMNYSTDYGATWTLKGDLTNSHTDSCECGFCDSDHWSSLAEKVDDNLHIFYVNDKDPGGVPQTEGCTTDNPMLYLAYPNPVRTQAVPAAPELVFPGNAYSDTFNAFVFEWSDPVGVIHYVIQVDDNQDFSSPIYVDNNVLNHQWLNPNDFAPGTYYWHVKSVGYYGESAYSTTWSFTVQGTGCQYRPGDINNNGSVNGVDIVYAVNYLKGTGNPPPVDCGGICPETSPFYAAGDVNGNCAFNGIDITYFVRFLKLQVPGLLTCPDCPPGSLNMQLLESIPDLKTKPNIKAGIR